MAAMLPEQSALEVLRRYADVLRVGSIVVNGETVRWNTDSSTENQLRAFSQALFGKLRPMPELARLGNEVVAQAAYWVCKAVSINYALIEVLLLIQQKVGVMCTIETREDSGQALITYSLQVTPTQVAHLTLSWRGKNNIVYRAPGSAEKQIKGTLRSLDTEFPLPPDPRFLPAYRLEMKFKRSLAARFMSNVVCNGSKVMPAETIFLDEPLRNRCCLESEVEGDLSPDVVDEKTSFLSAPISPHSSTLSRQISISRSISEKEVGTLRVALLQAAGLQEPSSARHCQLYYVCHVTGVERRSASQPWSSKPTWPEVWEFPIRSLDLRGEVLLEIFSDIPGQSPTLLGAASLAVSTALEQKKEARLTLPFNAEGLIVDLMLEFLSHGLPPNSPLQKGNTDELSEDSEYSIQVGLGQTSVGARHMSLIP